MLWCGTDITHFINGYWLDEKGRIKLHPAPLARWLNENCDNYVENMVEYEVLRKIGIHSKVVPSFLGNVEDYEISYRPSDRPKVYTSVSGNDFELYGWDEIPKLAKENPGIEFHLFGATGPIPFDVKDNIVNHGRVPKEEMNREIKEMQGALRLTKMDGFGEILAKSVLWGQWPVSSIQYPHMMSVKEIGTLKGRTEPNEEGREYYVKNLNKYPWNTK